MPAAVAATPSAPEERPAGGSTGGAAAEDEQNGREDRMWKALKLYIARDRQRKRKEYEASVEEERQRKEKEARQRQDVKVTLEETKEQIDQLELKLKQLEKEKRQLFMQLKKVINEDEVRKRQQAKENTEMAPMKMQMGNIQMPMFHPPASTGQSEMQQNQGRPPPLTSHMLNKQGNIASVNSGGVKRQRSPSPGQYPHNMYQHRMHAQPPVNQTVYPDHQQHKMEDGRMGRIHSRAVLWNKGTQYNTGAGTSNAGAYYHLPTSGGVVGVVGERPPPLLYAQHGHTQHHNLMYAPSPQPLYLDIVKPQHQDKKDVQCPQPQVLIGLSEAHHVGGGGVSVSYVASGVHNNMQGAKPGSITQGYPVRQTNTNVQNPNMYPNKYRY